MAKGNPLGKTDEEIAAARREDPWLDAIAQIEEANLQFAVKASVTVMAASLHALRGLSVSTGKPIDEITLDDMIAWAKASGG
jgi:hypothetical protein